MSSTTGPSRFASSVVLGGLLFAPAAFLVLRGNLSVHEALVRFGCALLFAMVGTGVVLSSMPAPGQGKAVSEPKSGAGGEPDTAPLADTTTSIGAPVVPATQPAG